MTAAVAVEKTSFSFDKLFDYAVPEELAGTVLPGCRVLVPFGSGNRRRQGVVFSLAEESGTPNLKPIIALLDKQPVMNHELIMLADWIGPRCFCTYFEAAKLMFPTGLNLRMTQNFRAADGLTLQKVDELDDITPVQRQLLNFLVTSPGSVQRERLLSVLGLREDTDIPERLAEAGYIISEDDAIRRVGDATVRMARLAPRDDDELVSLTPKQQAVTELLEQAGAASVKEICYFAGVTSAVVSTLERRGVIELYDNEIYRKPDVPERQAGRDAPGAPLSIWNEKNDLILTPDQDKIYHNLVDQYKSGAYSVSLLFGVTGSGKTSVFMRLIDDVLADGRTVIMMVPEIALTPQAIDRFYGRYGESTAILHSGLPLGQRLDEWKRIKNGEARLVIGTRSAVFAPLANIGAIIIDEEHEYTYKSESTPRYHARDVAKFRCAYHKAPLVLSSATPSLESYFMAAECGKYSLERLPSRYGAAVLPDVEIVDVSSQKLSESIISPVLREALSYNLQNNFQSILLHNRRGYNTFVACRSCGQVLYCDKCSVSMTYHRDNDRLMCHHCGASVPFTPNCPSCGAAGLRYAGLGTQRAAEELAALFPEARILRMDADSTMTRHAYAEKLQSFSRGDYDIMIGTQMIAKGLDFERVTLVGVLLADQTLCCDDFRSYERAFSLLTQVVGRSGRGEHMGKAIIQTLSPDNPLFEMAAKQDYVKFYNCEIMMRKAMLNPPFSDICMIGFVSEIDISARNMSTDFLAALKSHAEQEFCGLPMRVLGPSPASISRVMGKYRYRMIIKCRNTARFRELIAILLREVGGKREHKDVTAFADMNPDSVF